MKAAHLFVTGAVSAALLVAVGCSQEGVGEAPTNTAGSASGGAGTGTAGTTSESSSGTATIAGSATAGTSTGGNAPAAGTSSGGVSGAQGVAGSNTAGGTGPTAGSGGTGGGSGVTPAQLVPTLDGYLWVGTCSGVGAGLDCQLNDAQNQCPNSTAADYATRGVVRKAEHVVGGDKATKYTINFEARGIVGGKFYTGGKLRTTTYSPTEANDGWYEGGTPTDSKWNTWEIHVDPPVTGAPNVYYLNAFDVASQYDGWHGTFPMKFTASFPVMGGSKITLVIHDSNCLGQQNCGQTPKAGQPNCDAPRSMDLSGMMPQPSNFTQPYTQATDSLHPQWLFIDVKSISVP
jgi:hypothetical protein